MGDAADATALAQQQCCRLGVIKFGCSLAELGHFSQKQAQLRPDEVSTSQRNFKNPNPLGG